MGDKTKIEWSDATWNPVTGCTEVTPGCDNCYAKTFAERWRGTHGHYFEQGFDVVLRPDKLVLPLRWRAPRRVFVNSMSDLFHDQVPDRYIAHVFAVMALAREHTFQLLTKRHGRMRSLLRSDDFQTSVDQAIYALAADPAAPLTKDGRRTVQASESAGAWPWTWPLGNVWLGVSVEDQKRAELRIPALLDTPAAVRWLSCEPLLGPVDLFTRSSIDRDPGIDWVVAGGESGRAARPMDAAWARSLRDQCVSAGVPFLFKQWGEWLTVRTPSGEHRERVGKKHAGRELDGRTWGEYPREATRV